MNAPETLSVRRSVLDPLDLEFPANRDVIVRVVERPGLWMSPQESNDLLAELRSIVVRCLGEAPLAYGVLSGDKARLANAVLTLVYERRTRRPIAFNALSILDVMLDGRHVPVIHLGLTMVDPAFRTRGLSWLLCGPPCILLFIRNRLQPIWISNVTQIPSVVGNFVQAIARVYPTPDPASRPTRAHLVIARELMRRHRRAFGVGDEAGFDEDRFVITSAYTGGSDNLKKSFATVTKHRYESFNHMCRTELNYERGDDFLQIGQVTFGAAVGYLLRYVAHGLRSASASLFSLVPRGLAWPAPDTHKEHLRP